MLEQARFESCYQRLSAAERALAASSSFRRPTGRRPRWLGEQGPPLREAALREGFNTNALVLTEELVRTWARAGASTGVVWPTNQVSQWLLKRFVARATDEWLVMGLIYPATNRVEARLWLDLSSRLSEHQALLSGWELLGAPTLKRVQAKTVAVGGAHGGSGAGFALVRLSPGDRDPSGRGGAAA